MSGFNGFNPKKPCPEVWQKLGEAIPKLAPNDKKFALSLYDYHNVKGGWSDKQLMWANKMIEKANGAGYSAGGVVAAVNPLTAEGVQAMAAAIPAKVGDTKGIFDLFEKAGQHLKKPAIVLNTGLTGFAPKEVVLKKAKSGGKIWVVSPGSYGNSKFYGTISEDGSWMPKSQASYMPVLTEVLKKFAADPVKGALESAKLSGKCCFCNKGLTDPQSTSVGYGPICAKHFHLPWGGVAATDFAKAEKAFVAVVAGVKPPVFKPEPGKPVFMKPLDPAIAADAKANADPMLSSAESEMLAAILKDKKSQPAAAHNPEIRYLF